MPVNYGNLNLLDISGLASSASASMQARRAAAEKERIRREEAEVERQQRELAQRNWEAGNKRADSAESRAQATYEDGKIDTAAKRAREGQQDTNSLLGDHAEIMKTLAPEQQEEYYQTKVVPLLTQGQTGRVTVPEVPQAIPALQALSQSPGERISANKGSGSPGEGYVLKIDKNGEYIWMPKPGMNAQPLRTGEGAPPQIGFGQGAAGPMVFNAPRGGGTPTGTPIIGQDGKPVGKPLIQIPEQVKRDIRNNFNQLAVVNEIQNGIAKLPDSPTNPAWKLANYIPFGDKALELFDAKGAPTRQLIAQLSSIKMKDISGAVINAHEFPRLAKWIPQTDDLKPVVLSKLKGFAAEVIRLNQEMAQQYTEGQGFKSDPLLRGAQTPPPQQRVTKPVMSEADIDNMSEDELKAYLEGN
jgi:hypothetical protein